MVFSYSQISTFLACPRRYRYQYLEGWQEKQTRAAMLFGRALEQALDSYFTENDWQARWHQEWWALRELEGITYGAGESWQQMLRQGEELLEQFVREDRVHIEKPQANLQRKIMRRLDERNEFIGYVDAIGTIDSRPCLIDWKTSGSSYPAQPSGIVALDPQLICYSWLTGIAEVALVVFVRKRSPEIQYLRATISDEQRQEFGLIVEQAVKQIDAAEFPPHSGIRFPQNQCTSCAFIGLCLGNAEQSQAQLVRRDGVHLDWLDELVC